MTDPRNPFQRKEVVDEPGLIGATWWNHALDRSIPRASRRGLLVAFAAIAGVGALTAFANCDEDEDTTESLVASLEAQRDYGWNFGAATESVVFDGSTVQPYDRARLATLSQDLSVADSSPCRRYGLTTLFESPEATPRKTLAEPESPSHVPLAEQLRPIRTPEMDKAYAAGEALAAAVRKHADRVPDAFIVDTDGPSAVALAAGAAESLNPVMLFDNWPHPRGVVPSHLTLAAAVYYQPRFAAMRGKESRSNAPPLFVLDRQRLAAYVDDGAKFDNRYVAKLPDALGMVSLKVRRVYYVVESIVQAVDDLNDHFVGYEAKGIEVYRMTMSAFAAGGEPLEASMRYQPTTLPTRSTASIGTVAVVATAAGVVLGAKMNRSGSWNRASSWGGG